MKSIVYVGPNEIEYKDMNKPESKEGWSTIKISHSGICGGDLNIYYGTHPRAKAPLIMGHEFSGYIDDEDSIYPKGTLVTINPLISCGNCDPCKTGQNHVCNNLKLLGIDCDGGFAEYVIVPDDMIVPLPKGVTTKMGAFIEPVAVAVHSVREGGYKPGDNALVFGAGAIGLSVAITLRSFGCTDITVVENNDFRRNLAKDLGFKTINPPKEDVVKIVKNVTNENGADIVFDCAGHPSVASILLEVAKVRGNIVIVAGYKKPTELPLIQGMFKESTIKFVRVYTEKEFKIAADMVANNKDFEKIITHILDVSEANKGFNLLTTGADAVKVMYKFD